MHQSQEFKIRTLGPPIWTLKPAPLWFVIVFIVVAVTILVASVLVYLENGELGGRHVVRVVVAILILWTVNRMARTRIKVYREGLVIVRLQHLGTAEVFLPYESIQGVQAVFQKLLYFRLAISKSDGDVEIFGPCLGRGKLFEFISLTNKLMGGIPLDEKTMTWFRKYERKAAAKLNQRATNTK